MFSNRAPLTVTLPEAAVRAAPPTLSAEESPYWAYSVRTLPSFLWLAKVTLLLISTRASFAANNALPLTVVSSFIPVLLPSTVIAGPPASPRTKRTGWAVASPAALSPTTNRSPVKSGALDSRRAASARIVRSCAT